MPEGGNKVAAAEDARRRLADALIATGDADRGHRLYRAPSSKLFGFCLRICRGRQAAERRCQTNVAGEAGADSSGRCRANCTKGGGLLVQAFTIAGVAFSMGISSLLVMVPTAAALALVTRFGCETRGRDLRDLDADSGQLSHAEVSTLR